MSFIHYVLLAGAVVIGGIISVTTLNLLTLFFGKIIGLTLMRVSLYIREGYRYEKGESCLFVFEKGVSSLSKKTHSSKVWDEFNQNYGAEDI